MELRPISTYARELRAALPAGIFAPARARLAWLPVHVSVIVLLGSLIAAGSIPWPILPGVSLLVGVSMAGLSFLAHETLHGAVVRDRRVRWIVGWVGLLPFVVSPRLWVAWHNRQHHGNTNVVGIDPDVYPTLGQYQESGLTRAVTDRFALGGRRWTGVLSLLFGYTGQSIQVLLLARRRGLLTRSQQRLAFFETGLGLAVWMAVALAVGFVPFLFIFVAPVMVANCIVMAHILTNHGLSPLTAVNDPLVNSLTVTVPRWAEWLTLGFGYHTEHHLFPAMSARHAPLVRDAICARWPDRYQSMPLGSALLRLHRTARVYEDELTLVDPRTGGTWLTLGARRVEALAPASTAATRHHRAARSAASATLAPSAAEG